MSLDVYLKVENPTTKRGTGVFVRDSGGNRELTVEEVKEKWPDSDVEEMEFETDTVFDWNITHNLGEMAAAAGLYEALWRPYRLREWYGIPEGDRDAEYAFEANQVILANTVNLAGHVTIEDFVILEGLVAVQQFVKVGSHAFITGGTLVRKNVPPFVKAAREPLSYVGINAVGLRRRGFSQETVLIIEDIYRTIYVKGYNVTNALNVVEHEAPKIPEKDQIIAFIKESTHGIMRGTLQ